MRALAALAAAVVFILTTPAHADSEDPTPYLRSLAYEEALLPSLDWWVYERLAECESGLRWAYNGSSGYDGALQFHPDTWRRSVDALDWEEWVPDYAWQASREQQIAVARHVLDTQGWRAWPSCSRRLRYR